MSPAVIERALDELRAIANGDSAIRAVRHPLGFLCLPVERWDGGGVCVHVWSPRQAQARPTTSEIHAHSWELTSTVILGELRNHVLSVADENPTHRIFEVHSHADVDEMRATPRLVSSRISATELNHAGDTYTVPAGQFHLTSAVEATTIALGTSRPGAIDLSLGGFDVGTHHVKRTHCDLAETARAARAVVRQL